MNNKIKLSINNPCSETFDEFIPTKCGGYCDSCQKEVIDFTRMSEVEILKYLKNGGAKTCGRFRESQIKTYNISNVSKLDTNSNYIGAKVVSFLLFSFLSINKSEAQEVDTTTVIHATTGENTRNNNLESNSIISDHNVSGILVDSATNEPLPFANVVLFRNGAQVEGVLTDFDGKFKFSEALKTKDVLAFSYVGYKPSRIEITDNSPSKFFLTLKLYQSEIIFMGEVAINEVYSSKPSFWQKLKTKFR